MRLLFPGFVVLPLYFALISGALLGANVGYDAETVEDIEIYVDGDTFVVGDEESEIDYDCEDRDVEEMRNPVEQWIIEQLDEYGLAETGGEPDPRICAGVERLLYGALHLAAGVASASAAIIFHNQWIPQGVVAVYFQLLAWTPLVVYGWVVVSRVRELVR